MKTRYLFPHKFKKLGWILFFIGFISWILIWISGDSPEWLTVKFYQLISDSGFVLDTNPFWNSHENDISDEIISILIIIGGILVAFSKTKDEDEYISKIRMESLIWAVYVHYAILILCQLLVYGGAFFTVMIYNMFTVLLFFIVRFHFVLYKTKRMLSDEE